MCVQTSPEITRMGSLRCRQGLCRIFPEVGVMFRTYKSGAEFANVAEPSTTETYFHIHVLPKPKWTPAIVVPDNSKA